LTVDHLGTPILASTGAGVATWSGGFEPFGRDFTTPSAQNSGIFLRLPGQWDDTAWDNSHLSSSLYYNLNRWYEPLPGRYDASDPFDQAFVPAYYKYAAARPLTLIDPTGLDSVAHACCKGGQVSFCWDQNPVNPDLRFCVEKHENDHVEFILSHIVVPQCAPCTGKPDGFSGFIPKRLQDESECRAFQVEIDCLGERYKTSLDKAAIQKRIWQLRSVARQYGCNLRLPF
ncbi:MAG TPA: RHS repeat-associated core domain-containing protein, partial [Thermoanaerobaculia bacterium]|nr:RHS repeat-associated core domain-containing protein [Thermoanaerobaculia bacterium]